MRILNERGTKDIRIKGKDLAELIRLISEGTINQNTGKKVFVRMYETFKTPGLIIKEEGLEMVSDTNELSGIVDEVIKNNKKSAEDFLAGKEKALGFLMGQIMKKTKGKADPKVISAILKEKLNMFGQ